MKKNIIYLLSVFVTFVGCSKNLDNLPDGIAEGETVVRVALNADSVAGASFNNICLFWFGESDRQLRNDYYASAEELALSQTVVAGGNYTIVAVVNAGGEFAPEPADADLAGLQEYIAGQADNYPGLLTGVLRHTAVGTTQLAIIELRAKAAGSDEVETELQLTLPSPHLPDFVDSKADGSLALRTTAWIFKKGSTELFAVKRAMLAVTSTEGVYTMKLRLPAGEYDVNLWTDYTMDETTDNHYVTTDPEVVSILPKASYTANTDTRDGFAQHLSLTVEKTGNTPQAVNMIRPLAKYRLVATDVAEYDLLRTRHGYPALADLKIEVVYEGFLPCAYSISQAKPADSKEGYVYASAVSEGTESETTLGKDYVFVNGEQSSISVSILLKDAAGNTIGGVKGVKVAYRAGQLTTVRGKFLTAGQGSGIEIDTDWGGDHNVDF